MTNAQLSNQVIKLKKASAAAREQAARALVHFQTAKDQARNLKSQYKHARKLAKKAKKVAARAEEAVQEQERLLAKAQKKLLKARKAAQHRQAAAVGKAASTTAGAPAAAKQKTQVPQAQRKSVLPRPATPTTTLPPTAP